MSWLTAEKPGFTIFLPTGENIEPMRECKNLRTRQNCWLLFSSVAQSGKKNGTGEASNRL